MLNIYFMGIITDFFKYILKKHLFEPVCKIKI